jgi:hypothetical protein
MEMGDSVLGADYLAAAEDGDGSWLPAIRAAAAAFLGRYPRADLAGYKISTYREGDLLHVVFLDKERPAGMRGSGGRPGYPGFEVTLAAVDLAVVKAHFVK